MNACLRELAGRDGVELLVSHQAPNQDAPYDESQFGWMKNRFMWRTGADLDALESRLEAFKPDAMVLAGWHVSAYHRLAKAHKGRSWRVMCMDNSWNSTLKQWIGICSSPYYLKPIADMVWLPGERQSVFARKLGFEQSEILRGLYSCDQPLFASAHLQRVAESRPVPRSFLFAGRFVPVKGIEILARAYRLYREQTAHPWPLVCCGAGPLRSRLEGEPGVRIEGFVQPERMSEKLASAGCLILPSVFEPWALVIHEAASSGLLILASERVGAAVHLVQPSFNGFIFGNQDAKGLANLMARVSSMSDARLDAMSRASFLLSQQFSPALWANTLIESYAARQRASKTT
jgi:glycosyltransferase involved in cell wall biosynthesis